ncbi:hypothetical protein [Streptomyces buecherae]|uniref:Integral membrane protein n=1 Tax=Streptomyces buecherae TaxID=2763006 RepID=A0A7H8N3L9_9ACTN|nr:hypothetical protein [Streptomyces buecherae]QKW48979.1 hypothetical protein HUT08_04865 [Streptomyces buecherae]
MPSPTQPPAPARAARGRPPRFFGLMRATTAFLAATLLVQGITAGRLMSGTDGSEVHHATGAFVTVALVLQTTAAVLAWRADRATARYLATTVVLLALTSVQFVVGGSGDLSLHVPLGVALFGAGAVLMTQVWSARTTP